MSNNGQVTSHPPLEFPKTAQLTSAQRSEQMDRLVREVAALTRAVAELDAKYRPELGFAMTAADRWMNRDLAGCIERLNEVERAVVVFRADYNGHIAWHTSMSRSFWARLRWLVRG